MAFGYRQHLALDGLQNIPHGAGHPTQLAPSGAATPPSACGHAECTAPSPATIADPAPPPGHPASRFHHYRAATASAAHPSANALAAYAAAPASPQLRTRQTAPQIFRYATTAQPPGPHHATTTASIPALPPLSTHTIPTAPHAMHALGKTREGKTLIASAAIKNKTRSLHAQQTGWARGEGKSILPGAWLRCA